MLNSLSLLGDAGNTALPLGPWIPVKTITTIHHVVVKLGRTYRRNQTS